jgi:GNAT superfamily N-acetyltransferase
MSESPAPESTIMVRSAAAVPWVDVQSVFATRGDPRGCWCQYFKLPAAVFDATRAADLESALEQQTRAGDPTPGLVAFVDGEPAGWVAVEPRVRYPRLLRSRVVSGGSQEAKDDASVWSIVCFVVRHEFRGRGVSRALALAAVEHARDAGARVVEAYPVDTVARPGASASSLYHGTVSVFAALGFEERSRPSLDRPVVSLTL